MTGDSIIANAMTDIFASAVGVDALYTPAAGAVIPSLRVIMNKNVLLQPDSMTAQVFERGTTIEAMLADFMAEPNRGDTFVVDPDTDDAETFTVQSIAENDGIIVKMLVT